MAKRIGGTIFVKADGVALQAKGSWTIQPGTPEREMIAGADGIHGFKEMPRAPVVSGQITDSSELDVKALFNLTDASIVIELSNGKVFSLENSAYTGSAESTTEEGEISVEFSGLKGQYIV